jgi:hypothetical protein
MKWPLLVLSHNNNCSSSKSPNGGFFFGKFANFFFTNTSHSFSFPTFLSDISSFNVAWTGGRAPSRPHESFRVQDTKVGCDIAKQEGGKVSDTPSSTSRRNTNGLTQQRYHNGDNTEQSTWHRHIPPHTDRCRGDWPHCSNTRFDWPMHTAWWARSNRNRNKCRQSCSIRPCRCRQCSSIHVIPR